jgi:hypothetical protein
MMHTEHLRSQGLTLKREAGTLIVTPKSKITQPIREFLASHKSAILDELERESGLLDAARRIVWIEANRAGLNPSDAWGWLDISDLEWVGSGQRESVRALRAFCRYWSVFGSQTTGGHSIPFETKNSKR